MNTRLLAIFTAVFFFSIVSPASKMRIDETRLFPLTVRWDLQVERPSSKLFNFEEKKSGNEMKYWLFPVTKNGQTQQVSLQSNGHVGWIGSKTLKTNSDLVGFRNTIFSTEWKGVPDWTKSGFVKELKMSDAPMIGPSDILVQALVHAAYVRGGIETPAEFLKFTSHSALKEIRHKLLNQALFGEPAKIAIPVSYTMDAPEFSLSIKANFVLFSALDINGLRVTRATPEVLQIRKKHADVTCKNFKKNDVNMSRFCAFVYYFENQSEISDLISTGWSKPIPKDKEWLLSATDDSGRSTLMRMVSHRCARDDLSSARSVLGVEKLSAPAARKEFRDYLNLTPELILQRDFGGRTALHYALFYGCEDNAGWLVSKGASLDQVDFQGNSLLSYAIAGNANRIVDQLLPRFKNEQLYTPDTLSGYRAQKQGIGFLGIPIWERFTPIEAAVYGEKNVSLEKILNRKINLDPKDVRGILLYALRAHSAHLLGIILKYKFDLGPLMETEESEPIVLAYRRRAVENNAKNKDFFDQVALLLKERQVLAKEECLFRETQRSACLSKWGLCEDISASDLRDKCFAEDNRCELVKSPGWAWRCRAKNQVTVDVCAFANKDANEKALCELHLADRELAFKSLQVLFSSRKGMRKILESQENRFSPALKGYQSELRNLCENSPILQMQTNQGFSGYDFCSVQIQNSNAATSSNSAFDACKNKFEDSNCIWLAIAYLNPGQRSAEAREFLYQSCLKGKKVACGRLSFFNNPTHFSQAKKICEEQGSARACIALADSSGSSSKLVDDSIFDEALKGNDFAIRWYTHHGAMRSGRTWTSKIYGRESIFKEFCKDNLDACMLLRDHYSKIASRSELDWVDAEILKHSDTCVDREECMELAIFSREVSGLRAKIEAACRSGNYPACYSISAKYLDPSTALMTLARLRNHCGDDSFEWSNGCHQKAGVLTQNKRNDQSVLDYICMRSDHPLECTEWKNRLKSDLVFNKRKIKIIEQTCFKEKAKGACGLIAEYYLSSDAAKALPFMKLMCETKSPVTSYGFCDKYKETLGRLKRLKDLIQFFKQCSNLQNNQRCHDEKFYRFLAGEKNGYDKEMISKCEAGEMNMCQSLYKFSRLDGYISKESKNLLCQRMKAYCEPSD